MPGRPDDSEELRSAAEELLAETRRLRAQWSEILEALDELDAPTAGTAPSAGPAGINDPVRLTAVDLKLAGRSREDVENFLRDQFALEPDTAMLDDVFGSSA